jgi:hypothetical protein
VKQESIKSLEEREDKFEKATKLILDLIWEVCKKQGIEKDVLPTIIIIKKALGI